MICQNTAGWRRRPDTVEAVKGRCESLWLPSRGMLSEWPSLGLGFVGYIRIPLRASEAKENTPEALGDISEEVGGTNITLHSV